LRIDPIDLLLFYPENGFNIPFSVERFEDLNGYPYLVVSYGIIFKEDGGCDVPWDLGHDGDPEFCQVLLKKDNGVSIEQALQDPYAWHMVAVKCFAHVGAPGQYMQYDLRYSQEQGPEVWVQYAKHGIYLSRTDCNEWPGIIQMVCGFCQSDFILYDNYDNYLQNIGSFSYANSSDIDRYIWDSSTNRWVNIFDCIDFPEASFLMSEYKFMSYPDFEPDFYFKGIYQPDGNYTGYPTTCEINNSAPNPTSLHKHQYNVFSLDQRDACVRFEIYDAGSATKKWTVIGRLKKGNSFPMRIWNTSFFSDQQTPANGAYWFRGVSYSNSTDKYETGLRGITVLHSGTPSAPQVSSVSVTHPSSLDITFSEPVNFTKNSVKIKNLTTGEFILGEVFPLLTMFSGTDFSSSFEFIPETSLNTSDSYKIWFTKQDIYNQQSVVIYDYPTEPYLKIQLIVPPTGTSFSDDFNDGIFDSGKWHKTGYQTVSEHGGNLEIGLGSGVESNQTFNRMEYIANYRRNAETGFQWHGIKIDVPGSTDIAEMYTQNGYLHTYVWLGGQGYGGSHGNHPDENNHTYKIVWTANGTDFYLDGGLIDTRPALGSDAHITAIEGADDYTSPMYIDWIDVQEEGGGGPTELVIDIVSSGCNQTNAWVEFNLNITARIDVRIKGIADPGYEVVLKDSTHDWHESGSSLYIPHSFPPSQQQGEYYFRIHAVVAGLEDSENTPAFIKNVPPTAQAWAIPTEGTVEKNSECSFRPPLGG